MSDVQDNFLVQDILRHRVSLRKYADKPVVERHRELIIEAAMRAPTAGNMMLYSLLVISDPALKQKLSETCDHQPFIAKAPLVIVFLADLQRWFDYYQAQGVGEYCAQRSLEFNGPDEADLFLASCDALISAQNAVIAAEALGIGSCYIGDIMENYETHRSLLNLPPFVFPITMLCFGYYPAAERPKPRDRFDSQYIVRENTYQRLTLDELEVMFRNRAAEFNPQNSFKAANFAQWMYAKKTGAAFSEEMARSVRSALKNWQGKSLKNKDQSID